MPDLTSNKNQGGDIRSIGQINDHILNLERLIKNSKYPTLIPGYQADLEKVQRERARSVGSTEKKRK